MWDLIVLLFLTYTAFVVILLMAQAIISAGKSDPQTFKLPPLTVVVPAYNEEKVIERAIVSLLNSDYPHLHIIVVDDGSTDKTADIVRKYPVTLLQKKNEGSKALALNYGIRHARTPLIATMDADSFVMPDTLKKMARLFTHGDVWAVTGAIKAFGPPSLLTKLQYVDYSMILYTRKILEWLGIVHVTPGGLSMFRKQVFDTLGMFDPNSLCEDHEIAYRIVKAGKTIRSSLDALVYTEVPQTFTALFKQRMRWLKGTIYDAIKHWDLLLLPPHKGLLLIPLDLSFTTYVFLGLIRFVWDILVKGIFLIEPFKALIFFSDWSTVMAMGLGIMGMVSVVVFFLAEEWETDQLDNVPVLETLLHFSFFMLFLSAVSIVSIFTWRDKKWEKSRATSS